jgi:aryl-alcohol dehydrogenase-like predicted oxidoreductase
MDYRILGCSGLKVSAITFGTATFGGTGELAMGLRGPRHRAPLTLHLSRCHLYVFTG